VSTVAIGAVIVAVLSGCAETAPAPTPSYSVVTGWPAGSQAGNLGQVAGVGVEADGDVLVFRRANRDWFGGAIPIEMIASPTVLRFDVMGARVSALDAATFSMPHGLSVDSAGHIWVTDVSLQQVFELDARGTILRTLGERGVAGDDDGHFDMPTDVAVAPDGTFYVSDGYGNARVVKFAADGTVLLSFGTFGAAPGQFSTPHSIALGPDGNVWVADRGNARLQVFDTDGVLQDIWAGADLGRPWAVRFDDAGHVFVADGGDPQIGGAGGGRIIELDQHRNVLATFGSYGAAPGQMIEPHDLCVGADGAVYVGEVGLGRRAQKFVPTAAAR
jgi:peptidylamidoglycolate lyase